MGTRDAFRRQTPGAAWIGVWRVLVSVLGSEQSEQAREDAREGNSILVRIMRLCLGPASELSAAPAECQAQGKDMSGAPAHCNGLRQGSGGVCGHGRLDCSVNSFLLFVVDRGSLM
jgi:hypothetical protein